MSSHVAHAPAVIGGQAASASPVRVATRASFSVVMSGSQRAPRGVRQGKRSLARDGGIVGEGSADGKAWLPWSAALKSLNARP